MIRGYKLDTWLSNCKWVCRKTLPRRQHEATPWSTSDRIFQQITLLSREKLAGLGASYIKASWLQCSMHKRWLTTNHPLQLRTLTHHILFQYSSQHGVSWLGANTRSQHGNYPQIIQRYDSTQGIRELGYQFRFLCPSQALKLLSSLMLTIQFILQFGP
jgi:hypothetical protein